MLGFSLYPHHLKAGGDCTLSDFCDAVARTVERMGPDRVGIGSDLCQDQPDSVVDWMRAGRWTKRVDYGEGSADNPGFPAMPDWFRDNRDFGQIEAGLRAAGLSDTEVAGVMGDNWRAFFDRSFGPVT
jgi:microsomal dipeptidase-like Zn-dependent dipeptidase